MFHLVDFCRLCLTYKGEFSNICNDNIMEKVLACISDLEFEDHLPALICTKCLEQVDMFFDFRNRCLMSEFLLNSYVDKFLSQTRTSIFVNTRLKVNVLKNFAMSKKSLGNVRIHKDKTSHIHSRNIKDCEILLNNRDTKLDCSKKTCDADPADRSRLSDLCQEKSSAGVVIDGQEHNTDACINDSIFSEDDDDVFLEEEDDCEILPQNSGGSAADCLSNNRHPHVITKRKSSCDADGSKNKKSKLETTNSNKESCLTQNNDQEVDPSSFDILTDLTERVKLRKRQVAQTKNYSESAHDYMPSKPHRRDPTKSITPKTMHNGKESNIKSAQGIQNSHGDNKHMHEVDANLVRTCNMDVQQMQQTNQTETRETVTFTTFENCIRSANTEVENLQTKQSNKSTPTALNMGIQTIQQPDQIDTREEIATSTDYENDITTHYITSPKQKVNGSNNRTSLEARIGVAQPSPLYQANFSNLLNHHIAYTKKPQEQNVTYQIVMSSHKKPLKAVLPTKSGVNLSQLPQTTEIQLIRGSLELPKQVLYLQYPELKNDEKLVFQTSSTLQLASPTKGQTPRAFKRTSGQYSLLKKNFKTVPKADNTIAPRTPSPERKLSVKNKIDLAVPLVPLETITNQGSALEKSPKQSTGIRIVDISKLIDSSKPTLTLTLDSTISTSTINTYETTNSLSNNMLDVPQNSVDFKNTSHSEVINTLHEVQTSSGRQTQNSSIFSVEADSNQVHIPPLTSVHDTDHNYSSSSFPILNKMLSSNDNEGESPCLKELFAGVEKTTANFRKSSSDSPRFKKLYASVKKNTEIIGKLMQAHKIKKSNPRRQTKHNFVIDDPLNMLKLFKQRPRIYKKRTKCKKKGKSLTKSVAAKKIACSTNKNVNRTLSADELQRTSDPVNNSDIQIYPKYFRNIQYSDLSKSDSDDSEIDVVTVSEDVNVVTVFGDENRTLAGNVKDLKAEKERQERDRRRELFNHLSQIVPESILPTRTVITPVREILCGAKQYIEVLEQESQNLHEEHNHLVEKRDKLTKKLDGLKTSVTHTATC